MALAQTFRIFIGRKSVKTYPMRRRAKMSPAFDGDLRRHAGRYSAHTASQKQYDAHMAELIRGYLAHGADEACSEFLRLSFAQLSQRHGAIVGLHLPRPKLIPVPFAPPRPQA